MRVRYRSKLVWATTMVIQKRDTCRSVSHHQSSITRGYQLPVVIVRHHEGDMADSLGGKRFGKIDVARGWTRIICVDDPFLSGADVDDWLEMLHAILTI